MGKSRQSWGISRILSSNQIKTTPPTAITKPIRKINHFLFESPYKAAKPPRPIAAIEFMLTIFIM